MIEFTRGEIAHLTAALLPQPASGQDYRTDWSCWRRCHQYAARIGHYRRQAAHDHDQHGRQQPARPPGHQPATTRPHPARRRPPIMHPWLS